MRVKNLAAKLLISTEQGKRVFIKDITHYLMPPKGAPASIAPSCLHPRKGVGTINEADGGVTSGNDDDVGVGHGYPYATAPEGNNPTVIPRSALEKFHFSFLIRHPRSSVPSYYRCTIPPLDAVTGFRQFLPEEMGYHELRRLFDYLRAEKMVGPRVAGRVSSGDDDVANGVVMDGSSSGDEINDDDNNNNGSIEICVIDADDLLDNPTGVIQAYCRSVGIPYDAKMLVWDDDASHEQARAAFAKWKGFHDDAIRSRSLRARVPPKSIRPANDDDEEQHYDREWTHKFGPEAAALIRRTVDENVRDYEYLKGFALKV